MVLDMRDNIYKVKNMVKENFIGQMPHRMKENLLIIIYVGKVDINGVMDVCIMVIGKIIKWKVKEYLHGRMEENMLGHMLMIKNMDLVYLSGQMVESMKECGKKENNMEKECILVVMVKRERVNGLKVKELNGLKKKEKAKRIKIIKKKFKEKMI